MHFGSHNEYCNIHFYNTNCISQYEYYHIPIFIPINNEHSFQPNVASTVCSYLSIIVTSTIITEIPVLDTIIIVIAIIHTYKPMFVLTYNSYSYTAAIPIGSTYVHTKAIGYSL